MLGGVKFVSCDARTPFGLAHSISFSEKRPSDTTGALALFPPWGLGGMSLVLFLFSSIYKVESGELLPISLPLLLPISLPLSLPLSLLEVTTNNFCNSAFVTFAPLMRYNEGLFPTPFTKSIRPRCFSLFLMDAIVLRGNPSVSSKSLVLNSNGLIHLRMLH